MIHLENSENKMMGNPERVHGAPVLLRVYVAGLGEGYATDIQAAINESVRDILGEPPQPYSHPYVAPPTTVYEGTTYDQNGTPISLMMLSYVETSSNAQDIVNQIVTGLTDAFTSAVETYGPGVGHIDVTTAAGTTRVGSFEITLGLLEFGPGWGQGSGLNPGSTGGASTAAVEGTIFMTLFGIPGGGGLPGEGTHPVPYELE